MDDDALFARVDEVLGLNLTELRQREEAPYDGIMGKLDGWLPENFHREFSAIRDKLLVTYRHRDLLDYIAEMRREYGMQGKRDAGELAELIELHGALQEREFGLSTGGMFSGCFCPRTPRPIWEDVCRLAQSQEAVELGPEKGLALLLGDEHAKTSTIGANTRRGQTEKAKKSRGKIGDNEETNNQIIGELALTSEYQELTAKELWSHYWGALDSRGLDPTETEADDWKKSVIEYDFKDGGRKSITGGQFANVVSNYRNREKSG